MFNSVLRQGGLAFSDVRLLRHKDQRATKGHTPYELWRDDRPRFELYQSTQTIKNRNKLRAPFWASFVGTPSDETLFVGLYAVKYLGLLQEDTPKPHTDGVDKAGSCDTYRLTLETGFSDLGGKLFIEWGPGKRSWIQRADQQDKRITEYLHFADSLSRLDRLPRGWVAALESCRGVYLLTCPKTKEQYVGSATGEGGFWRRWQDYVQTGHGGNVGLKSREPSDYQVSILEVAGTAATSDDIFQMEARWKSKLQSREMGLNRN
jgi:hypothetical protein